MTPSSMAVGRVSGLSNRCRLTFELRLAGAELVTELRTREYALVAWRRSEKFGDTISERVSELSRSVMSVLLECLVRVNTLLNVVSGDESEKEFARWGFFRTDILAVVFEKRYSRKEEGKGEEKREKEVNNKFLCFFGRKLRSNSEESNVTNGQLN